MQSATPSPQAATTPQTPATAAQGTPTARWRAFKDQREELSSQMGRLEDRRSELVNQLDHENLTSAVKTGIETRIADIDKRITDVEKQLSVADANVSSAASVPGAVVPPPVYHRDGPPEEAFVIGGLFIVVVFLPLSIAMARRIWRKGSKAVAAFPQDLADRLSRLDQAVDSIAVEVERIGEGQRFVTRVMADNSRAIGAGPAQPIEINQGAPASIKDARR